MKRSSKHITAQRRGRERNLGICQICGSKDHPEGHHLIDFVFGGVADKDNIVTLCQECHKNVHKGLIDLFKF